MMRRIEEEVLNWDHTDLEELSLDTLFLLYRSYIEELYIVEQSDLSIDLSQQSYQEIDNLFREKLQDIENEIEQRTINENNITEYQEEEEEEKEATIHKTIIDNFHIGDRIMDDNGNYGTVISLEEMREDYNLLYIEDQWTDEDDMQFIPIKYDDGELEGLPVQLCHKTNFNDVNKFKPGDRVKSMSYGSGTVLSLLEAKTIWLITYPDEEPWTDEDNTTYVPVIFDNNFVDGISPIELTLIN